MNDYELNTPLAIFQPNQWKNQGEEEHEQLSDYKTALR